jgi:hypothetical protein
MNRKDLNLNNSAETLYMSQRIPALNPVLNNYLFAYFIANNFFITSIILSKFVLMLCILFQWV